MAARRVWRWASLGTVVALGAVFGAWAGLGLVTGPPLSGAGQPLGRPADPPLSGAGQPLFASLPDRIAAGPGTPDLPAGQPVGRAAFIYSAHEPASPIYVVTVDGHPYRVGTVPQQIVSAGVTLSPDGRWLARQRGDRWEVRDLMSRVVHTVAGQAPLAWPLAWSVDGRALLWRDSTPLEQPGHRVMDTASGRMTDVAFDEPIEKQPLIMLNDHELATVDYTRFWKNEKRFSVNIVDVRSGNTLRSTRVDLSPHLRPGEHTVLYIVPLFYVNGSPTRLWTTVNVAQTSPSPEASPALPIGVIGIDLASGRFLTRLDWPSRPARGDVTSLAGAVAEGAVLYRLTDNATEISVVADTGEHRVVTRLPGAVHVFSAGRSF